VKIINGIGFRAALAKGFIQWRKHTLQRIAERKIKQSDVIHVLKHGEIIRNYSDDKPFPSALVSGSIKHKHLHIVAAFDEIEEQVYIITVYEPSSEYFEPDFKTRKRK
jgi:hypothetical protein